MLKTVLVWLCFFLFSYSNLVSAQCSNYTTCSICVSSGHGCYWSSTHSVCTNTRIYSDSITCCGLGGSGTSQCSTCSNCANCTTASGCLWSPTFGCSSTSYSDSQTYCSSCVSSTTGCSNCANCSSCVPLSNCYWSANYSSCTYGPIYGDSQGYCGTDISCVPSRSGCYNCANCSSCVAQFNCYWSPTHGCTYRAIYGDSHNYCGTSISAASAAATRLAGWMITVIVIAVSYQSSLF